ERSPRTAAVRRGPGPRRRPLARRLRAARGPQDEPLDVVRLPADRRPGAQRDRAGVRHRVAGGGRGLPAPPRPRPAAARVHADRRGGRRVRSRGDPRGDGRDEAAVLDDAVRPRRAGRARLPAGPGPLLRRGGRPRHGAAPRAPL
ncbi:MAG: NTP pyrophosphohydrolases including oxidative damage repair enzymes, partial [uncultured Solirubrobacteraceae bacterium]